MSSNKAAWIKTRYGPIEVEAVELWAPERGEVLVRNEAISFNPIDAKIQKLDMFKSEYPLIGGFTFAGTVIKTGPEVASVKAGDRVAIARWGKAAVENRFGAFQQYAIGLEQNLLRLEPETSLEDGAGVIANLATVVSALTIHMGLSRPPVAGTSEPNGKRIFIYGGSSAVGGLAVKYATDAGYHVVTTSSPRNRELVEKRKAAHIIDHTRPREDLIREIQAHGPYEGLLDSIASPAATRLMGELLQETGGLFFSTGPTSEDSALPGNVHKKWAGYSEDLVSEASNSGLRNWYLKSYLPAAMKSGEVWPNPPLKLEGGLDAVQRALDLLYVGKVSGSKVVVNPSL
ncbi:hypothetical protein NHJ13734_007428 [Beauveria thailandica]